jgi:hypothetical protein
MIGLILWLLPDIGGIQYDSLQRYFLIYIGLSVFWPAYIALNAPGLPWISFQRVMLFVVMSIFLWNFSTSQELRDKLRDSVSETPISIRIFWLFWATTTVSIAFASPMPLSISKYINNQIYWTMVLFVSVLLATRPGFVMKLSKIIVFASIIVILYSISEFRQQRVPWIDYLPAFLKIDPELLQTLTESQARAGTDMYRVRGPYPTSLYFSEMLTMFFPFFLHFTAVERRILPFLALLAGTFGMIAVMYFTGARSAMIGLVLSTFLYSFYMALRARTLNTRSLGGSFVVFGYPFMAVVLALVVQFWQRAHVMLLGGGAHQASSDARSVQWAMTWPKLATHPLGYGVGRGNAVLGFLTPSGDVTVDSYFITILLDSGVLALPFFILTFLVPAAIAFKYVRSAQTPEDLLLAPLSLGLINFIIVKSVLSSEGSMSMAFTFVGCIIGLVWQRNRAAKTAVEPTAVVAVPQPAPTRRWQGEPALPPVPAMAALPSPTRAR